MHRPIGFRDIKNHPIRAGEIRVYLVWFDSYGAKSSCLFIETPDLKLLVDPGAAAMQPGYPLPDEEKKMLKRRALKTILAFSRQAEVVFISHYHYDHHTAPSEAKTLYRGKALWIKNPNCWINLSQWKRARKFLEQLSGQLGLSDPKAIYTRPEEAVEFPDPTSLIPLALARDYGDYQQRKDQLLDKGRAWFKRLAAIWQSEQAISPVSLERIGVRFCDGWIFEKGSTKVRFTEPMFHGIEFDRVGWVVGMTVEHGGRKVLYTSDVQGPGIEDYARWIIRENPDTLVLDGPPTYLFGFMVNRINMRRAIENVRSILMETDTRLIIYDHHCLREARYRERLEPAYRLAREKNKNLIAASELLGFEPLILEAIRKDRHA